MPEPQIIHGPTAPTGAGVIYQVTLEQGLVMTSPSSFGPSEAAGTVAVPVVTEDGRVLLGPVDTL